MMLLLFEKIHCIYEMKLPILNSDWGKKEFKRFERRTIESIKSPEKEGFVVLEKR